ncbi:LLM class flavin-dependent oxidoreductase [Promicromonospora thailandica]|uniref:Flavin-dependent oxidoreductase, luciferase family (Includes alkanesulfonate monooxygenase SsuD and methylene tetrahydromethanopterin reductase) n=1 Tax=Promicromonospora thailandica TaxID=765201 RepID=A0A9X2G125_9MICO|nr:LLM class flavin-dependent oxidoreductase [Promicromonospora thailandica]MCP2264035.1 Flavin-dependent oxidoreductase, luciferase family (includes alkanesulfonate monooxygenase SsuD and methylene tetrahydromethanopterin reductase) [Promicromonospora thailandica]BFF17627.1 LLM class flavin-dependent oxidoreductase [Promicromonospora thailandica]
MPYPPQPTSLRSSLRPLALGVDLTAAGARPGAHRSRGPVPPRPFDGERFLQLVRTADRCLLDLVTLDEDFLLHPGRGQVTGRLDTVVAAARAARVTTSVGLVPAVDTVHVEAAHAAVALSSVDRASGGRAGWQAARQTAVAEADEAWAARVEPGIQSVHQVWTGRPGSGSGAVELDADGRFRVDHDGIRFAVRGRTAGVGGALSRVRPPVVVRVRSAASAALAGRTADVARVVATETAQAARLRRLVRDSALSAGRDPESVRVLVEVYVVLAQERAGARARLELVEALEGTAPMGGALVVADTPDELATLLADWAAVGAADGFLLRPSSLGADLDSIADHLVPALQRAGLFRTARTATTLRGALGLPDAGTAPRAVPTGRLLSA